MLILSRETQPNVLFNSFYEPAATVQRRYWPMVLTKTNKMYMIDVACASAQFSHSSLITDNKLLIVCPALNARAAL
jgi:hypothetical protein